MVDVYGYLRVSTDGQTGEDRFGLAEQKESIQNFADNNGFNIIGWYSDPGISGTTLDRPGLQSMIADSAKGQIKAVIVAKMDRIARDLMAQLWIEKELLKNGVEIISVSEQFRGQDPANVLFRQIIGAFAQFEKSRITERLSGGRKQKAKIGGYAGGRAALGYSSKRGSKILSINPEKAEPVKRVFELKDNNQELSLQKIADILNQEGYTTAQGKRFYKETIKRILDRREFYKGLYSYSGIESRGLHQAII